jgi:hypothetical protein
VDNLLASIQMNVHVAPKSGLFQREATCFDFDRQQLKWVHAELPKQCQSALELRDGWMRQHALPPGERAEDAVTVVVGTYITIRNPGTPS